jgi:hypothetical protein
MVAGGSMMREVQERHRQAVRELFLRLPKNVDEAITVLELLADTIEQASAQELGEPIARH